MPANPYDLDNEKRFWELYRLIKSGDVIAIRKLIAFGTDVNLRNRFGSTLLSVAAHHGRTDIAGLLLSAGANVHAVSDHGCSALADAALKGHCRTMQLLLDAGAATGVRPYGMSLLAYAGIGGCQGGRHIELLLEAGAE